MDDINLIRTVLLDEGEEGEQARATARLRLQQAVATERAGGVRAKRRPWFTLAGAGLVAAAAAAVLVVSLGAQPETAPSIKTPQTAQEFLLAAATRAAGAPATTGKYWHARWDMHFDGSAAYSVVEQWQAANPADPSWSSSVRFSGGVYRPDVEKAEFTGYGWEAEFSAAEVAALPTEPEALKAALTAKNKQLSADLPRLEMYLFKATAGLLARAPQSPAQRAAGYRLLASLPGVELAGTATDSEGRTGVLLRYQPPEVAGRHKSLLTETDEVIVDQQTYQVLAVNSDEKIGTRAITSQIVFKTREWTDTEPPR